jgi:hypothetical protein
MKLKVDVDDDEININVIEYKYPGAPRSPSAHPIVLTALAPVSIS